MEGPDSVSHPSFHVLSSKAKAYSVGNESKYLVRVPLLTRRPIMVRAQRSLRREAAALLASFPLTTAWSRAAASCRSRFARSTNVFHLSDKEEYVQGRQKQWGGVRNSPPFGLSGRLPAGYPAGYPAAVSNSTYDILMPQESLGLTSLFGFPLQRAKRYLWNRCRRPCRI